MRSHHSKKATQHKQRMPVTHPSTSYSDESRALDLGEVVGMGYNQPQLGQQSVVIEENSLENYNKKFPDHACFLNDESFLLI